MTYQTDINEVDNISTNVDGCYVENSTDNKYYFNSRAFSDWDLLTLSEFLYILNHNKVGVAYIGSLNLRGLILLPDNFSLPEGLSFSTVGINNYTREQWYKMEDAGVVLFPAYGKYYPAYHDSGESGSYQGFNEEFYYTVKSADDSHLLVVSKYYDSTYNRFISDSTSDFNLSYNSLGVFRLVKSL